MTIVAGFLCSDGAVIAADSEHTGTSTKFNQNKIVAKGSPDGSWIVMAGAGETDYVSMTIDLIEDGFEACKKDFQSIRALVREAILDVYQNHIAPLWGMGNDLAPQVLLVVAVRLADGTLQVWKTQDVAIVKCRHTVFVGHGTEAANALAAWLYPVKQPWVATQLIAK